MGRWHWPSSRTGPIAARPDCSGVGTPVAVAVAEDILSCQRRRRRCAKVSVGVSLARMDEIDRSPRQRRKQRTANNRDVPAVCFGGGCCCELFLLAVVLRCLRRELADRVDRNSSSCSGVGGKKMRSRAGVGNLSSASSARNTAAAAAAAARTRAAAARSTPHSFSSSWRFQIMRRAQRAHGVALSPALVVRVVYDHAENVSPHER